MSNYLTLPATSGNYASTPDTAALDITGDIELICKVALDDWTPSNRSSLVVKSVDTGNQRSYGLFVRTDGKLRFEFSIDGTIGNTFGLESSVATGLTNGQTQWIRASWDACVSSTEARATFYLGGSGTTPTWAQLGSVIGLGFCSSIKASTALLEVGSQNGGSAFLAAGNFYVAQVVTGIAGTVVADFDADDFDPGDTGGATAVDSTGKTWTINGANADIVGPPSGVSADAVSSTAIDITWTDIANNTGYSLERSPNGSSGWTEIATPGANDSSYSDTGLDPETTYYYRIISVFGSDVSSPSTVVDATTSATPSTRRVIRSPRYGLTRVARR